MAAPHPDAEVERLRELLAPLEAPAAALPWAERRRWRVTTHVGHDGALPVIDLHDLSAGLAKRALRAVAEAPPPAGLVWVHGRGGTRGKREGVLGRIVLEVLGPRCAERGWRLDPQGPRTTWITDPSRAPTAGTPGVVVLVGLLLLLGVALMIARACGA